ncbi:MAG: mechanosensitive ion channel family protein [Kiloniellales bacterium]|nr:mechanosensitive ion channel family protein [Kiloniellales bacterium]
MSAFFDDRISDVLLNWLISGSIAAVALILAFIAHWLLFSGLAQVTRRTAAPVDEAVVRHSRRPARLLFLLLGLFLVLPGLPIPDDARASAQRVLTLALTAGVGWLAFSLTRIINVVVAARYDVSVADNLAAREAHTRVRVLQRILAAFILVVTVCLILMAIPSIRQIGVTLFASAGIAGIVAGFAARPVLSNLIAGIQLALTQPIRIDDVVIVENEWGWVEEIHMTYVVVRIWDLRRLVVPLSYFIEKPFQNWTRKSADILGTVFLHVDYTVPVQEVRGALHRILEGSPLWDHKVWNLQVTGATDKTLELRALMSARNSGDAWNLRCEVREGLIDFLQKSYPDALPRLRAELPEQGEGRGIEGGAAPTPGPSAASRPAEGAQDPSVLDPEHKDNTKGRKY